MNPDKQVVSLEKIDGRLKNYSVSMDGSVFNSTYEEGRALAL